MTTPLITYQELRKYPLPVKETQWDAIGQSHVEETILQASQHIEDWLDRGIASAYYTERIFGSGNGSLLLDQYPIQSLISVTRRDNQETSVSYDVGDFLIDSSAGIIRFSDRFRNAFFTNYDYIVSYQAGYDTIPHPIKYACALQTVEFLQPMFRGGQNFSEVKLIDGINEKIVDVLEFYKRKRIG